MSPNSKAGEKMAYTKADFEIFQRDEKRGVTDALNKLGVCYLRGWGIPENEIIAVSFFSRAAAKKHVGALYNLGLCNLNGWGFRSENLTEAAELFTRSAKAGFAPAEKELGRCYEFGWGVEVNRPEAERLYCLADGKGNEDARRCLHQLHQKYPELAERYNAALRVVTHKPVQASSDITIDDNRGKVGMNPPLPFSTGAAGVGGAASRLLTNIFRFRTKPRPNSALNNSLEAERKRKTSSQHLDELRQAQSKLCVMPDAIPEEARQNSLEFLPFGILEIDGGKHETRGMEPAPLIQVDMPPSRSLLDDTTTMPGADISRTSYLYIKVHLLSAERKLRKIKNAAEVLPDPKAGQRALKQVQEFVYKYKEVKTMVKLVEAELSQCSGLFPPQKREKIAARVSDGFKDLVGELDNPSDLAKQYAVSKGCVSS
jgi:TPR repeat protein